MESKRPFTQIIQQKQSIACGDDHSALAPNRKIIHVDMDAFFASVEQRDRPELRGKPVIVGGDPWERGVVCTCSYEARPFGVRSGMATSRALQLCPRAIFLPVRMDLYRAASEDIFKIFRQFTPLVEGMSIDEAYLDVTSNLKGNPSASCLARQIQDQIFSETGLTASAGVSYNLFLAKIASAIDKPNGLTVIPPQQAVAFLENLPVHRFYGIGRVTVRRLHDLSIYTGKDLKKLSLERLSELFGKAGHSYYEAVRGIDRRQVIPVRVRKSLGKETTFPADTTNLKFLCEQVADISRQLAENLQTNNSQGKTVTLKMKYADFHQITRSQQLFRPTADGQIIGETAATLLVERTEASRRKVRLIGVSVVLWDPTSEIHAQQEFNFTSPIGQTSELP
jgi:DNA polymerase-4